jgi:ABC-type multidrug transport system ATPase subunit
VIRFEAVSKSYTALISRKRVDALADFTLEMARGEVVGIAGPNGAGKSTMISLLMGFLQPTAGRITIDGATPRRWVEGNGVGYLTELVNLPPRWKVPTTIRRMATLSGVPAAEVASRSTAMMSRLGLDEHAAKRIKQLSKGNLQRVGLAQALIGDFELVVLDEPTHGLDPLWTQRFRDVVRDLRRPDRLVIIASHNLDELEMLADRVAILDHGRLQRVVAHSTEERHEDLAWRLVFEGDVNVPAALANATAVAGRAGTWRCVASRRDLSAGLGRLLVDGAVLVECVPEEGRLESAFREAVQR